MTIPEMDWYSNGLRNSNAIIDDTVEDKIINKDERKIININACRLYHGVIYPGEMMEYTGRSILQGYLFGNGSYQKQQHKDWLVQPCKVTNSGLNGGNLPEENI